MSDLAPVLQEFFTRRLISQRQASPRTIAAYRDTFRLLLGFAAGRAGKQPSALSLADLDAPMVTAFLEHLEAVRGNTARTRTGRRDHAMLALAIQAGLRVSELTGLTCADIRLRTGPHVHCTGKGRKERDTPLLPATTRILRAWLAERAGQPGDPLFPGPSGQPLSRDAVERRVALYAHRAAAACPSIAAKHVTAHTLRHTAAMRLLLGGADITVIALWMGHESITSTQAYLHADMKQKEQAIARTAPPGVKQVRYKPPDPLLAFLENL